MTKRAEEETLRANQLTIALAECEERYAKTLIALEEVNKELELTKNTLAQTESTRALLHHQLMLSQVSV